ncbi:23S rRNA (guanosine(2251)-2'-O)-methyltransferase RlmB [Haliea sp. AH-315-K21]|uniref:23S rRNA (guanosine-2'-O-)-methyltransferase RlmB n=1 Tax=SAR86 cluster bacterium TaxID=2030880 RepID=A0A2A5CHZ1_9GAMM|nr:23S rRNA (guanosine(2251)-2'-O)-methyltransferase RlmB [Haliea sp. AH-315-K21]MBN4075620.1 23S rRNA (guanosine(2251)-2'-O)-methyltransferase RlmB [Gammaproteobacteria bacterium AH-315-E17]PCJ43373.1 MAG: 23S rRNA (guanosine(2251)-2'-O)-methyltransferase RlmB [SAR86 cluster bacterium]
MNKNEWVFGIHAINALLKHRPEIILQIYLQSGRLDERISEITDRANSLGIPVEVMEKKDLDKKAGGTHQGTLALCKEIKLEYNESYLEELLKNLDRPPLLLVLDGVTDPHNLGACLRSAEAAGVDAVIVAKDKSALMNATVRKVACGAAEIIPFIVVTNLVRCLQNLQKRGVWIMGAAGEADKSIYNTDLKGALALVLGAEGSGLRRLTRETCDQLLSIPMAGETSSLNVSVATGVFLFEALRQRLN